MAAELKKRTGLISANASIREMLVEMLNGTYAGGMTSRQEYHLRSRNLIEPGRPIRLADLGRWQAIMQKMRHILPHAKGELEGVRYFYLGES